MTIEIFSESLDQGHPPAGLTPLLQALWWEAKGDWARAHEIAQEIESREAAWVHAYLHRREGDTWNAGYWYRRSGRPECSEPLEDEWRQIVTTFLSAKK